MDAMTQRNCARENPLHNAIRARKGITHAGDGHEPVIHFRCRKCITRGSAASCERALYEQPLAKRGENCGRRALLALFPQFLKREIDGR